jgi:tetratricopeptide (TPR) repeat protein
MIGFVKKYRYKAFISYSHHDESWARWLQRALESYRVPKRLVGKPGSFGQIPERLGAVFRDREDLSSAASLGDSVSNELAAAEMLVVICSPAAAASRWVNEEIKSFRALGRDERIYALIVDGDPQSVEPGEACFPAALIENEQGDVLEPLAADARKWADGKLLAKQKLISGILGIRLDDLRRRDMQRRRRKQLLSTAAALAILAVTSILTVTAITSRKAAEQRRANTEELLSYMFGKLESLSPVSGLDFLDDSQQEVISLAKLHGFSEMPDTELMEKARAWRKDGQSYRDKSDRALAMQEFQKSRVALIYLYQRDPTNRDALFELGQAEFWVGYVHWDKLKLDLAEEAFTLYGVITRRLINAEPTNADFVMELSYTLTNLAAIKRARISADPWKAIELMQAALEYHQLALVLEPDDEAYKREIPGTQAHLADAWLGVCNLGKAYQFRAENTRLARQFDSESPGTEKLELDLAYALSGLATVQSQMGLLDQAEASLRESESRLEDLGQRYPENNKYRLEQLSRQNRIAQLLAVSGEIGTAWQILNSVEDVMLTEFSGSDGPDLLQRMDYAQTRVLLATLALARNNESLAATHNQEAIEVLAKAVRQNPDHHGSHDGLARALIQYWSIHGENPDSDLLSLIEDYSLREYPVTSCGTASLAAQQAIMREDKETAEDYTSYLLAKGYYEPAFVKFCKENGLCENEQINPDQPENNGDTR